MIPAQHSPTIYKTIIGNKDRTTQADKFITTCFFIGLPPHLVIFMSLSPPLIRYRTVISLLGTMKVISSSSSLQPKLLVFVSKLLT